MKRSAQFLFLVPSLAMAAGCGNGIEISAFAQTQKGVRGTFERTLTVDGPVDISLRTGSGDVDIRTGAGDRVQVVGHVAAGHAPDALERIRQIEAWPPIEQTGNFIRIGHTGEDSRYHDVSISYELLVPANTQVTSRTGSGDQTIGSVNGIVRAKAGSGDIRVERAGGGLDAQTGSGDIQVDAVAGVIRVETGSGDIDLAQVARADVEARTGSGDVLLSLPSDAAFTLEARTGSGSIETSHPLQVQGERRKHRLQGTVRGGGNRVDIRTGSGSIRIR